MEMDKSKIAELAKRWLSYPEEIRKQIHDWERLDAIAHEELGEVPEEKDPAGGHDGKSTVPFGMRLGSQRFSKPKSIGLKTVPTTEEI